MACSLNLSSSFFFEDNKIKTKEETSKERERENSFLDNKKRHKELSENRQSADFQNI